MRISRCSLLLCAALLPACASGQWAQTNGPFGGRIYSLLSVDGKLFAGASGSVFVSTNSAAEWTDISDGLPSSKVFSMAAKGDTLFAACLSDGVFRSTNNGSTWSVTGSLEGRTARSLFVIGPYVFVGTSSGVFRSSDNGTTWVDINGGLPEYSSITSFVVAHWPANGSELYAGTSRGVFSSSDSGGHWTAAGLNLVGGINALACRDSLLFAASSDYVFVSSDRGGSWSNGDAMSGTLSSLAVTGSFIFVGVGPSYGTNGGRVRRSHDDGATWADAGLTGIHVYSLASMGTDLLAGTEDGIYLSADNGSHWTLMNSGLTALEVTSIASFGAHSFAGSTQGVFLSTDVGSSWILSGLKNRPLASLFFEGTTLLAGLSGGAYGWGIFVSPDSGKSWPTANLYLPTSIDGYTPAVVSAFARSGMNLFAAIADRGTSGGGVYRSTDGGVHWERKNIGFTGGNIWSLAVSGAMLFAGGDSGRVFCSADTGAHWTATDISTSVSAVGSLAAFDTFVFAGTDSDGVFRSTNEGASWTAANVGLTNSHASIVSFVLRDSALFAGTFGEGVFLSTNQGERWENVSSGLPMNSHVTALGISDIQLVTAIENAGVWTRPLSQMIVSSINSDPPQVPLKALLEQNYPNPFNPRTVVRSQTPEVSHVRMVIYDVLGREVAVLVNERRAAGRYQDIFDGSSLSSGIYICRMTAGAFALSRKMLLVK